MNKHNYTILYMRAVLYLAMVLFFVNDGRNTLLNGKWEGLLSWLPLNTECLIVLDWVLAIVFCVLFLWVLYPTIKIYRWKTLWVFVLAVPVMFAVFFVYGFFLFPLLHALF